MTDLMTTTPRDIYEDIAAASTRDGLDERVLAVLRGHVGKTNRIRRAELVAMIFAGAHGPYNTESEDRQVRLAIARLRERHPILSSSGNGGYWMASGIDELVEYQREISSRVRQLEAQSNLVQTWAKQLQFELEQ